MTNDGATQCAFKFLNVCFERPSGESFNSFFGFAEFITALALIAVVFTISDARYRFRIAVAPFALIPVSYWCAAAIGLLILLSDVWFSEKWPIPVCLSSQILWQGVLGAIFLLLILVWMFFAFLNPAKFSGMNSKQYIREMYRIIVRGDDAELPTIASEFGRSVISIVDSCLHSSSFVIPRSRRVKSARHAHDLLLLIGNRKFCRYIVSNSPGTAIMLFQRISETQKYYLPLRQFTTNISTEAISNTDSILYHEDEGYHSGLLGYVKPFSAAVFGDYRLVEGLGSQFGSPFDIHYKAVDAWNAMQLGAYCRAVQITFRNYLAIKAWHEHSYALTRALQNIEGAFSDVYKLDDPLTPHFPSDIFSRDNSPGSMRRLAGAT